MNQNKQRGSIEIIIIAVLVIGIIGAIGYTAWNNHFNAPSTQTNTQSSNPTPKMAEKKDPLTNTAGDQTFNTGAAVKYPDGWKYEHTYTAYSPDSNVVISKTPLENTSVDTAAITSPSGNIILKVSTQRNSGIGGVCDNSQSKLLHIHREPIHSYPNVNYLEYIERRGTDSQNYYHYSMGVARNEQQINDVSLTSNTACTLTYANILNYHQTVDGEAQPMITISAQFNDLNDTSTYEQIKSKFSGEEYETAKSILRSLYKRQ